MPIKKIEIHGLNPDHPLATVVDEINENLDNIVTHINGIDAETGVVGPTGAKGDKGDPGAQGIEGPAGVDGKDGQDGKHGVDGQDGSVGPQGLQGIQGVPGVPGNDGKDGLPGAQGPKGDTGAQGPQGIQGPAGVGIKGFAAGYVDAGQFVTLDNMKFTVTTGGQRGLTVAAVTGTLNLMISGTFGYINGVGGSATTQAYTYTTTPNMTGSWFGWSFPNQGDGSVYLVNDVTNYRFYRVTLMIGPGYAKNFISIERLS